MSQELCRLTASIAHFIMSPDEAGEAEFNRLALAVFEFQYRFIEPYRSLCRSRDSTPDTIREWSSIPAVPADAFKSFDLFAGKTESAVRIFKSSGTTAPDCVSRSYFSEIGLELMNSAVEVNARERLFPDGRRTRLLVIAPNPDIAPHMIMVHGMNQMISHFGIEGSRFLIGSDGLKSDTIIAELQRCQVCRIPVTLIGGSFGFVHLFDSLAAKGLQFSLPEGSRLMDAGGYKGRSREVDRIQFVRLACTMLGLQPENVTNLLGMTELASQVYDTIASGDPSDRAKRPPHWMRTLLIDPRRTGAGKTLAITEPATRGLLRHFDLANVERPMAIQTEDIGVLCTTSQSPVPEGFEILGRAMGAEPRGCSLSFDEFSIAQAAGDNNAGKSKNEHSTV
jgi:Acyl-protein synthetase, LuxE